MSLEASKEQFKTDIKLKFKYIFSNSDNESNPYKIDPYDENGNPKSKEEINELIESKLDLFAEDLANIIYNLIKSASVVPGISVIGTCPSGAVTGQTSSTGTLA